MIFTQSAGISDIGQKRSTNEDAIFMDDSTQLYVVADGMGGHLAGEVASKLAVETLRDCVSTNSSNCLPKLEEFDQTLSKEANQLLSGISLSNQVVKREAANDSSRKGMGTTVSAVYFTDDTIIAANVGDSPIYLIRNRTIELLSVLHTLLDEKIEISPEYTERFGNNLGHILTRAIGVRESVQADIHEIQCFKEDVLVISSDGLSDKATPDEILKLVNRNDPDQACRNLINLANDRGGDDNISVIIIKVRGVKNTRHGIVSCLNRLKHYFFHSRL